MLRLAASNLDFRGSVAHAFFGRKGGVSDGAYASLNCGPGSGDDRARVVENRSRAMGALVGVIRSTVDAMEALGARRARIVAAVGPCISQSSYEVGDELRASVEGARPEDLRLFVPSDRAGHWRFDLSGYAQTQLRRAG